MKKILLLLVLMLTALPGFSFDVNGISYDIIDDNSVSVRSKSSGKYSGDIVLPSSVEYSGNTYTVTEIGFRAFNDCTNLNSVEIPNSVTKIAQGAFYKSYITSLKVPSSVTEIGSEAFSGCIKLKDVELDTPFADYSSYVFNNCSAIENLYLNCKDFNGTRAYLNNLKSLKTLKCGEATNVIPDKICDGASNLTTVEFSNVLEKIGEYAFRGCTSLKDIKLPDSLKEIGHGAFGGCEFENIELPNSVNVLGESIFASCNNLKHVKLPQFITEIPDGTFWNCKSLESVIIPDAVVAIRGWAFEGSSIKSITIGTNVSVLEDQGQHNVGEIICLSEKLDDISIANFVTIGTKKILLPKNLELQTRYTPQIFRYTNNSNVVNNNGMIYENNELIFGSIALSGKIQVANFANSIGEKAMLYCDNIEDMEFLPSKTPIFVGSELRDCVKGSLIFNRNFINERSVVSDNCRSVVFSEEVTEIPENAFLGNVNLTSLHLPPTIKSIGRNAFTGCNNIASIVSAGYAAPMITEHSFDGIYDKAEVEVPGGTLSSYLAPNNWWILFNSLGFRNGADLYPDYIVEGMAFRKVDEGLVEVVRSETYKDLQEIVIPDSILMNADMEGDEFSEEENFGGDKMGVELYQVIGIAPNAFSGLENIKFVTMPSTVRYIGDEAFKGCLGLTNIVFGANVESIGVSAFKDCSFLQVIDIPESVKTVGTRAFAGCDINARIAFGNNMESIGSEAFIGNKYITELNFNGTEIGKGAFKGCTGLTEVDLGPNVEFIGSEAFTGCNSLISVKFGDGKNAEIHSRAFKDCAALTSIEIGEGYVLIGDGAFQNDSKISSLKFAENGLLKHIGDYAFDGCQRITELIIPDMVEYIGDHAFYSVRAMTTLHLPANENLVIGNHAFYYGQRLTTIETPVKIKSIGEYAFANCSAIKEINLASKYIGEYAFTGCSNLENFKIEVDTLNAYAFNECVELTSAHLMGGATVPRYTFKGCTKLEDIILDVYAIGAYGMTDCTALKHADLSGRIEIIEKNAFYNITSLQEVEFGTKIRTIEDNAFNGPRIKKVIFPYVETDDPVIVVGANNFNIYYLEELSLGNRMKTYNAYATATQTIPLLDLGTSVQKITGPCPINKETTVFPASLMEMEISSTSGSASPSNTTIRHNVGKFVFQDSPNTLKIQSINNSGLVVYPGNIKMNHMYIGRNLNIIYSRNASSYGDLGFMPAVVEYSDDSELNITANISSINAVVDSIYYGSGVKIISTAPRTKNVVIAEGVESINSAAINNYLQRVLKFPASLETISGKGLKLSDKVEAIVFSDSEESLNIESQTEEGYGNVLKEVYLGRNIISPNNEFNFSVFPNLKTVIIGNNTAHSATAIAPELFKNCYSLENAILSERIIQIGASAFQNCKNLKVLVFPEDLQSIGDLAYSECSGLERIVARTSVPVDGEVGFSKDVEDNVPLYVPDEAIDDYMDADLFFFFNIYGLEGNVASEVLAEEQESDDEFDIDDLQPGESHDLGKRFKIKRNTNHSSGPKHVKRAVAASEDEEDEFGFYWFSPNPDAATITQEGVLTVLKDEPAEIWAYALDGSDKKAVIGVNQIMIGDLNSDRKVNTVDLEMMIGHIAAPAGSTIKLKAADINGDGIINTVDLEMMIENIANEN